MSRTVVYVTPNVPGKLNTFPDAGDTGKLFLSATAGSLARYSLAGYLATAGLVVPPVGLLMVPLTLTAGRLKAFSTQDANSNPVASRSRSVKHSPIYIGYGAQAI